MFARNCTMIHSRMCAYWARYRLGQESLLFLIKYGQSSLKDCISVRCFFNRVIFISNIYFNPSSLPM